MGNSRFKTYGELLPGRHLSREVVNQDKLLLASLGAIGRGKGRRGGGGGREQA